MKNPIIYYGDDGCLWLCFRNENKQINLCLENEGIESSWNYVGKNPTEAECYTLDSHLAERLREFYEDYRETEEG